MIKDLKSQNYSPADVLEELVPKDPELKRCVVITLYNSKIYQLDGIDFKLTPKTHTFKWRETNPQTREITEHNTDMVRYMDIKYGIKIPERDQNQPLLIVHERDQVIYLIPSLCNQASLPKNFTSDSRKMKDLQDYKLSNPNQRYDRINTLIERIQQTDVLDQWGLKINPRFANIRAKQLPNAKIQYNNKQYDWEAYEKKTVKHAQPIELKREAWALVYGQRDFDSANILVEMMQKASGAFGIRVEDPQWVEIPRNDN